VIWLRPLHTGRTEMPYQPHRNDVDSQTLCRMMGPLIEDGQDVYVQWTCPKCGERSTSSNPTILVQTSDGHKSVGIYERYHHEEKADGTPCGYMVHALGYRFGYVAIKISDAPPLKFPL
jgi:hypothetical protein